MPAQRIVRLLPGLIVAAHAILGAAPAYAEDAPAESVAVLARAHVSFAPITGGWRVCGDGSFDTSSVVAGVWVFAVAGDRDGVPFVEMPQTGAGALVHLCANILKSSATGLAVGSLTYTAAGSYVVAASIQGYTWDATTGDHPFGLDPRP